MLIRKSLSQLLVEANEKQAEVLQAPHSEIFEDAVRDLCRLVEIIVGRMQSAMKPPQRVYLVLLEGFVAGCFADPAAAQEFAADEKRQEALKVLGTNLCYRISGVNVG